jgi:hypothetical protein
LVPLDSTACAEARELNSYFKQHTKWIEYLIVRVEIVNLLKVNKRGNYIDTEFDSD